MDALASRRTAYVAVVVRDVLLSIVNLSSLIFLCLALLLPFLSANNDIATHRHPQAKHGEVRDCVPPHAWIII